MNDVVLNKKTSIERCVKQIRVYYARSEEIPFEEDYLSQDAIAMNLQWICELAIDIANHWVKVARLGLPKSSADAFALLAREGLIDQSLSRDLQGMVGFRNVLVHAYTELDLDLIVRVIEEHLQDPVDFASIALKATEERS